VVEPLPEVRRVVRQRFTLNGLCIVHLADRAQPEVFTVRAEAAGTGVQHTITEANQAARTDERIDTLIDDFFIIHGAELSSLLRMKFSQFERNGSTHAPGVIEGANDADTLYRRYVMSLIRQWTGVNQPLMFRDDVLSVSGAHPFLGARTDRRKRKLF